MSVLTIQMSPDVEEILTQFMREQGLTDRSEAVCFVLREALQEEDPRERRADERIAAERKAAQSPPQRLRCAHDTWD